MLAQPRGRRRPSQALLPLSRASWSPARPDLVSPTPASFCQFYEKFYQDSRLRHREEGSHCRLPAPAPAPAPKSPSVCTLLPITCKNSIRKHLSTPSLFTFKGLNSLFTGLSTTPRPSGEESPGPVLCGPEPCLRRPVLVTVMSYP